jgi:hypothetical protein
MLARGLTLSLTALIVSGMLAESAGADQHKKPRRVIADEEYYAAPPIIRMLPGVRIFFGDYALSEEEFDRRYGKRRRFDESYYEPQPAQPRKKPAAKSQAQKKAAPADQTAKAAAATGLSCDKAASVVAGYGFTGVTPASCGGKTYAFNATRDGKFFAIKLNAANGELTEVKKLP